MTGGFSMKSIFEELGGTYTLGEDGMYYRTWSFRLKKNHITVSMVVANELHKRASPRGCIRSFCSTESWYHALERH